MNNIGTVSNAECVGCEACRTICPKGAITMVNDDCGFRMPFVNRDLCVNCGKCLKTCPVENHSFNEGDKQVYALMLKDKNSKYNSSSGGAFYWIASDFLRREGIVYGAAFDASTKSVQHIRVDTVAELRRLQNSKYVQSRIGESYHDARCDLEAGRSVLFSGTPCQIAGLYSFLGKQYPELYTCDIMCYGVPSPLVLTKYLEEVTKSDIEYLNMREKSFGWKDYSMLIKCADGQYRKKKTADLFHLGFQTHLFYRECCYTCKFRKTDRVGDFTLGDFWGFKESFKKDSMINDDTGISFFMINNKKAVSLFERLDQSQVICEKRDLAENIRNYGFNKSMDISDNRATFFENLKIHSYSEAITPFLVKREEKKTSYFRMIYQKMKKRYLFRKLLHFLNIPV